MKRYLKGNSLLPSSIKLTIAPTILIYSLPLLLLFISFNLEPLVGCARGNQDANKANENQNYAEMRARLGYFSHIQFNDFDKIYEDYWQRVLVTNDKTLPGKYGPGDWPRVRPFADMCVLFLVNTQQTKFVLKKPHDIILLDACLDWLYGSDDITEKNTDITRLNKGLMKEVPKLESEVGFKNLSSQTAFKDLKVPDGVIEVIQKYLLKLMNIYIQYPGTGCHSLWLEAYDDFLEDEYLKSCTDIENCDVYLNWSGARDDSYIKLIFESTKLAAERCYKVLIKDTPTYLLEEYAEANKVSTALSRFFNSHTTAAVREQLRREKWTREMMLILQIAQNSDSKGVVNLGVVSHRLQKIKQKDSEYITRFVQSLSAYTKEAKDVKADKGDLYGHDKYAHAMIKLCRPFVDQGSFMDTLLKDENELNEERHAFEFYHIVNSLVRLTDYHPIVNITKEDLERDIIDNNWEALYLATFTCQLVSTTWVEKTDETNEENFDVTLKRGWEAYVVNWPIEYIASKLVSLSNVAAELEDIINRNESPFGNFQVLPPSPAPKSPKSTWIPKSPERPQIKKKMTPKSGSKSKKIFSLFKQNKQ